ncbi:MAG: M20/M25/M40 family metallo-hydrolase [Bryobacterales bacterium]|nr:M20/M25/M40 family metallo-hydrolase [Bryobacterales bacterium]MBV9399964.1 M20/M25/M40 family metallo-hydrolase [Bryobacterales bacterium]
MRWMLIAMGAVVFSAGCSRTESTVSASQKKPLTHVYRPEGDQTVHIDMSKIKSEELKKVYAHIDEHFDEHVDRLQKWIRQPSISNSGEGIQETAEMVKGFYEELGCQAKVYDTGVTEWGLPGNPVVFGKCDEGAPKTVAIYWQYDTMPVTQPDAWKVPPFDAAIVPQGDFKKVLVARGATNSKGPEMSEFNALMSIRAVRGKLPVNVIFIAEGDEERMDIGLRNFVKQHAELVKADTMLGGGSSEGCVYIQLTTSGKAWGRGPVESDIHGSNKRSVDSPAWRHIKMLASLVSDDGNTPLIQGWKENWVAPSKEQLDRLRKRADKQDVKTMAENLGVARYIADDPYNILRMQSTETSFNLDGIWGGNMYADAAGAILPNKITSKHNIRYVPNMNGMDLVKKVRAQLDRNGYKDVEMKVIGDVPWSTVDPNNQINTAAKQMQDAFGGTGNREQFIAENHVPEPAEMGGYWPSYLFNDGKVGQRVAPVGMPIGGGRVGRGGRAHAANEFYVIEGAGTTYGMAGAEKSIATVLYNYAGLNQ